MFRLTLFELAACQLWMTGQLWLATFLHTVDYETADFVILFLLLVP